MPYVHDFASAELHLAGGKNKDDRPLCNRTRLKRVDEDTIVVRHHATNIVAYLRNGSFLINTGGWSSVSTRERINTYSPARVGCRQNQMTIWHNSDLLTEVSIKKCRTCKGAGKIENTCRGPGWCYVYGTSCRHGYDVSHQDTTCFHGQSQSHPDAPHECYRCKGAGERDYGSNPIPYLWDGSWLAVDSTGKALGPGPAIYDKHVPYKPVKIAHSIDGHTVQAALFKVIPGLDAWISTLPCGCTDLIKLHAAIVHLNDTHRWSRERIADWLEILPDDVDIRFTSAA